MTTFEIVDETTVLQGTVVTFTQRTFRTPDGALHIRDVVKHPGAVSVVPVDGERRVILVRQFRAAIGAEMWEIPAGKLDVPGEDLEEAARRELREEIGYVASELAALISFHNSPGFCDELQHTFLATGLEWVGTSHQGPEEEAMEVRPWTFAELDDAVAAGEITDAKTIVGILMARRSLDGE